MPDEPKPTNVVNEANAAALKAEQEAIDAIDTNIPVAPWLADQHAALTIRNLRLQIDDEIEPAMAIARRRHNEPGLRVLGEQKANAEDQIRLLLYKHPGARTVLETWMNQEEPR